MDNNVSKKKIKIGINASYLRKPNTGIGQVTINFLKHLKEVNNNFTQKKTEFVLYLEEELEEGYIKKLNLSENVLIQVLKPAWKRDDLVRKIWWEKYLLAKQVKKDQCDVFISLYQSPLSFSSFSKIKHLMIVHDIIPELFSEYLNNWRKKTYWWLTKKSIRKANRIVAVSKNTEKDLIKKLGIIGSKITVAYIDVADVYKKSVVSAKSEALLKKYQLKPGYILAGGGYEKRKNIQGVLEAYKILLKKNKKLFFVSKLPELVIYGKVLPTNLSLAFDPYKALNELNLTQSVKILGEVQTKDLPALFKGASFFIYPSFYEGFGLPVLEAMNSGVPVVTSKKSSLPEVGNDSVLYCSPNDLEDMAMVMKNLLTRKELRRELKKRSQKRAQIFSWQKFNQKIFNIIEEIK
jgi:glycosyltransferase involved in cell wall biosynthesis